MNPDIKAVFLYICDFLSLNDSLPGLNDFEIRFGKPLPAAIENSLLELKSKDFIAESEDNPMQYQISKNYKAQKIKTQRALLRFEINFPNPVLKHDDKNKIKVIKGFEQDGRLSA